MPENSEPLRDSATSALANEQNDEDVTPREHTVMAIAGGLLKAAGPQFVELRNAGRRLERLEKLKDEQGRSGQLDEQIETASQEYCRRSAEIVKAFDRLKPHG